ncbi:MAG TPA: NAD(+)/NADH kinase [Vicinamibacterales bacterium]|nr:NAD(+)/NADH kinase [Vicinamibacterales bacterium]
MPPVRVSLIARTVPEALTALEAAAVWLEAHGVQPSIEEDSAAAAGLAGRWPTVPRASIARDADAVIAFGGDGTLLNAAQAMVHSEGEAPLMGINLGRLGFLTEVGPEGMVGALEALIAGRTTIETRAMLTGRVRRGEAIAGERLALNDIVVTRGALSRMIEIEVFVDGPFVCHVKADGLIVATATGSTAYNLSAGGPIVHPSVDAFVLTPIAPHTLTNRPLVLPAGAQIALRPAIAPQSEIVVTFDGQFGFPLEPGDVVEITRAPRLLRLVHTLDRTHFDMLRNKLRWGTRD